MTRQPKVSLRAHLVFCAVLLGACATRKSLVAATNSTLPTNPAAAQAQPQLPGAELEAQRRTFADPLLEILKTPRQTQNEFLKWYKAHLDPQQKSRELGDFALPEFQNSAKFLSAI